MSALARKDWYLVSSHGAALFYIAVNPGCTISQISDAMSLTRRSVWGLVNDLRRARMLHVRRDGRRCHYSVDLDGPFLHPTVKHWTLRAVLSGIVGQGEQSRLATASVAG